MSRNGASSVVGQQTVGLLDMLLSLNRLLLVVLLPYMVFVVSVYVYFCAGGCLNGWRMGINVDLCAKKDWK